MCRCADVQMGRWADGQMCRGAEVLRNSYGGAEVVLKRWCLGGREEVPVQRCRCAEVVQWC